MHDVRRRLARLEAGAGLDRRILINALLEPAWGVNRVEETAAASPRMQGMSLGPADLAASRRMKTTRVGGGHPGYVVRTDPTGDDINEGRQSYQQDLWHYTMARSEERRVGKECRARRGARREGKRSERE